MKKYLPVLAIFIFTLIFYVPIIKNTDLILNRGNDLSEFFWPIYYFTKQSIINFHQLPFWNNLFFSGTPLLPDPQAPIFYLPNLIFLIFKNIDTGFIISIFLHIFAGGIGMYMLSKKIFKFSDTTSLFCSFLYISSPKLSGYIEAGHFGLIASWGWLPFVFLTTVLLSQKPTFKKVFYMSVSLAGLFYTHVLIFVIATISVSILYLYISFKNYRYLILSGLICFGLIAISFLPQLAWQNQTTRNLLLNSPDLYPKWISKIEFLKSSISPILFGYKYIWSLDTEKIIALGLFTSAFSFIGFIKLKTKNKFLIATSVLILVLISLNNISPIYNFFIKQNWYILLRVSTRFWFLIVFIFIYLAGLGFQNLIKFKKSKFLIYTVATIAILELLLTSWTRILKPIVQDTNLAPKEVYSFLSRDKDLFRVFCLNRCLSQKESAIYGLQLADGYGTLQQTNYYEYSEQLSQSFYRNKYTLSIPPFEIFEFENLQPYSPNLSTFNIKYVISNHKLNDKNLKLLKSVDKYSIYENEINNPRSNYPINYYSPNFIQIDTSLNKTNNLILSEVFNKDWHAYLNGKTEININETTDKTREVEINKDTKYVNFIYEPLSFKIGLVITILTLLLLISFTLISIFKQK